MHSAPVMIKPTACLLVLATVGTARADRHPTQPPYDVAASSKRVLDTYASFDFTRCGNQDCGPVFRKAAGGEQIDLHNMAYEFNPARSMPNPDPEWLPGWDQLPKDDGPIDAIEVYRALALARSHKTWLAKCHADYATLDKKLREMDAGMTAAIAKANAETNPYARLGALFALRTNRDDAPPQEAVVGARYELELAIRDAFKATGRDYLWALGHHAPANAAKLRPRLDAEFERDVYCARAIGDNRSEERRVGK